MSQIARHFLFVQGPHGPFFRQLARALVEAGHITSRIGVNAGDEAFWPKSMPYRPLTLPHSDWPGVLRDYMAHLGVSDLVIYGEARPIHAAALQAAHGLGLRTHLLEEGYLRPNWITYERIGTNGNSPICQMSIAEMQDYLDQSPSTASPPQPSASWGALRHHMYHGAVYHAHLMRGAARYPNYQPHRGVSVTSEAKAAAQSLLARPLAMLERAWKMHRLRRQPYRNHVVLCQLAHDSSLRAHGPFHTDGEFFETVIMAFAEGSTAKDRLIFKAHPLEDNFGEMRQSVASLARDYDLPPERVICLPGGRLAPLLDIATTAITVTSTAAMQALWRGLPLYCFGHTIYDKPGLTFEGNLQDFFTKAAPPDAQAFDILRRFLLAGCQLPGGFYTPKGRKQTIARLVPLMLRKRPIYDLDVAVTDLHFGPRLIASQNSPHVPR